MGGVYCLAESYFVRLSNHDTPVRGLLEMGIPSNGEGLLFTAHSCVTQTMINQQTLSNIVRIHERELPMLYCAKQAHKANRENIQETNYKVYVQQQLG